MMIFRHREYANNLSLSFECACHMNIITSKPPKQQILNLSFSTIFSSYHSFPFRSIRLITFSHEIMTSRFFIHQTSCANILVWYVFVDMIFPSLRLSFYLYHTIVHRFCQPEMDMSYNFVSCDKKWVLALCKKYYESGGIYHFRQFQYGFDKKQTQKRNRCAEAQRSRFGGILEFESF